MRYFRYTYNIVRDAAAEGKTILFVGTKKQAGGAIKEYAEKCGMPYVNHRWLGGMMTNFGTIRQSIRKLEVIEKMEEDGSIKLLTKKEALMLTRKKRKIIGLSWWNSLYENTTRYDFCYRYSKRKNCSSRSK